jgi:hypothetical protein
MKAGTIEMFFPYPIGTITTTSSSCGIMGCVYLQHQAGFLFDTQYHEIFHKPKEDQMFVKIP